MWIFKDNNDNVLTTREVAYTKGMIVGREMALEAIKEDETNGMVVVVISEELANNIIEHALKKHGWKLKMYKMSLSEWE